MVDELHALLDAREGHFSLESGLHGNLWLDLDTPFSQPDQLEPLAARLADLLMPYRPVVVCGPLVGGALLAQLVALSANMRLTYAERVALVPGTLWSARYELVRPFRNLVTGKRVVVVDDVVNAGSALRSTVAAVREAGGDVVATGALLRLGDTVLTYLAEQALPLHTLAVRPASTWPPDLCPLCQQGQPLDT